MIYPSEAPMVSIAVREGAGSWFGVAWSGSDYVATAIGDTREDALTQVTRCLPPGTPSRYAPEDSLFALQAVRMLAELESGCEEHKRFRISSEYRTEAGFRILTAAAAIPVGYVSTYGTVAEAAQSEARAVGRAMATNPLYPIVPCHRVVGTDFSMIGYGGRQDLAAIAAKLRRLKAEARGYNAREEIELPTGLLSVYPVEWVLDASRETDRRHELEQQRTAEREALEALQYHLFQ